MRLAIRAARSSKAFYTEALRVKANCSSSVNSPTSVPMDGGIMSSTSKLGLLLFRYKHLKSSSGTNNNPLWLRSRSWFLFQGRNVNPFPLSATGAPDGHDCSEVGLSSTTSSTCSVAKGVVIFGPGPISINISGCTEAAWIYSVL